jgi:hypothetical protein
MENNFNNDEFIKHLNKIKEEDPDRFMDMVLDILKKDESYAFEDGSPLEKKQTALSTMIKRYEELERYEDCAFLNRIKGRLV